MLSLGGLSKKKKEKKKQGEVRPHSLPLLPLSRETKPGKRKKEEKRGGATSRPPFFAKKRRRERPRARRDLAPRPLLCAKRQKAEWGLTREKKTKGRKKKGGRAKTRPCASSRGLAKRKGAILCASRKISHEKRGGRGRLALPKRGRARTSTRKDAGARRPKNLKK